MPTGFQVRRSTCLFVAWMVFSAIAPVCFAADMPTYNRDIRPILAENCFSCHGPDSASRKADLRLDRRDAAVEMQAIVPGDLSASELVRRILSDDENEVMPPPATKKTLTAKQKETLQQWISQGAEYQPHWSLITPTRPKPPEVTDTKWGHNPIDNFILARLEGEGLTPAPEADRRTLARRLSLDLTGLPPDPAVVDAFVADQSPNAYEKLVDEFLESPSWGEHRGRAWLDAARYADTHGIHFDNYREMWAYRDWVINAFNENLPYDQFTIEQLAGDLLPNKTLDQQIASGFNRCNITTNEGGLIDEEYLVLYTRDRTETVAQVWLGLTAGCAVCHDHKFDPLSQREFYEMAAFFNNTTQGARDGNIKDTPPIIFVPQLSDRPRWNALDGELAAAKQAVEARRTAARTEFDAWQTSATAEKLAGLIPGEGLQFAMPLQEAEGNTLRYTENGEPREITLADGIVREPGHVGPQAFVSKSAGEVALVETGKFEKDQGFSYGAWIKPAADSLSGAIFARMDDQHDFRGWDLWLEAGKVGAHIISKWPEDAVKVVSKNPIKAGEWSHVFITYDGSAKATGVKVFINGVPQETAVQADALKETIQTDVPFKLAQRHTTSKLPQIALQDVRLYGRTLTPLEVTQLMQGTRAIWLTSKPAEQRNEAEQKELYEWWLTSLDQPFLELKGKVTSLEQEQATLKARGTVAHVMNEKNTPAIAYVLFRGDYDKRRDEVSAATPAMLPEFPEAFPRNRLGFAQWLLQPDHPTTSRVAVNRFWQEVFGTGIVKTTGDFGVTGDLPSHPELLDWLAVEFRESGWDIKQFFKLMVTSAAYRQAALNTPEKLEKDPANRLLSRGPRFRMEGEMVRDFALAASGLIVEKLGGPSVKPYQPEGVWEAVAMIGSNTRNYVADKGEGLYRRSLYTFWKRSAPPASMDIFNAPSREVCTVRRERTNTPLQALVTLNSPQFVEAARHLAERALQEPESDDAGKMNFIARRLVSRSFRPEELAVVTSSLAELQAYYAAHPEDAKALISVGESKANESLDIPTLAAWTMLTNELMNLDEVLNK